MDEAARSTAKEQQPLADETFHLYRLRTAGL